MLPLIQRIILRRWPKSWPRRDALFFTQSISAAKQPGGTACEPWRVLSALCYSRYPEGTLKLYGQGGLMFLHQRLVGRQ